MLVVISQLGQLSQLAKQDLMLPPLRLLFSVSGTHLGNNPYYLKGSAAFGSRSVGAQYPTTGYGSSIQDWSPKGPYYYKGRMRLLWVGVCAEGSGRGL